MSTPDTTRPDETETERRFVIRGDWLCESIGECTCGGADQYGHEPGCGLEPVGLLVDVVAAHEAMEANRVVLERLLASRRAEQREGGAF